MSVSMAASPHPSRFDPAVIHSPMETSGLLSPCSKGGFDSPSPTRTSSCSSSRSSSAGLSDSAFSPLVEVDSPGTMSAQALEQRRLDSLEDPNGTWVKELSAEIAQCYLEREARQRLPALHATGDGYSAAMRRTVVDWMVQCARDLRLCSDTLFLAVRMFDSYMARCECDVLRVHLKALICVDLACKYEEILPPPMGDFVALAAGHYDVRQLVAEELLVLHELGYELTLTTPLAFSRRFLSMAESLPGVRAREEAGTGFRRVLHYLCSYLLQLSLYEAELVSALPSRVAAAALLVALNTTGLGGAWQGEMEEFTGCSLEDPEFVGYVRSLHALHAERNNVQDVQAVHELYRGAEYSHVALMVSLPLNLE